MIYPTVYVPRDRFESTLWPRTKPEADSTAAENRQNFVEKKFPVKIFVMIRDLRDTLVSLYFSLKVSHAIISENVAEGHRRLNEMEIEEGFLYLCGKSDAREMEYQAKIQSSWLPICQRGEALLVRYEDLIHDELGQFEKIAAHCEIDVSPAQLREIVGRNSFLSRAGRQPGEEDVASHYRKGISGDWQNYFTPQIKDEFKRQFGQVLIETGYEKDLNW
jgi:lipopolysaccharide transport system ATP-binding protein